MGWISQYNVSYTGCSRRKCHYSGKSYSRSF